jgi:HTH-type transcriptional regulator, glycine betaine synthesis regulator
MKTSSDLLSVSHHPAAGDARTLSPTRCDMVEAGGRFWQMLGLPRSTGQIYGLLYLSSHPLSLDDIVNDLGISKASASTGTRQLVAWGVIKQVWIPGERRDFFEVVPDLNQLLRIIYQEQVKRRLEGARIRLDNFKQGLDEAYQQDRLPAEEHRLITERVKQLERIQKKIQMIVPLVDKLVL